MLSCFSRKSTLGTVAFNLRPARGPWGGSSLFVSQFSSYLKRLGFNITYSLDSTVDIIILVDPRTDQKNKPFGTHEIRRFKEKNPGVKVLHRINECDHRKNTAFMDSLLGEANELADYTVFISSWLAEYHISRWFDPSRPHTSIYNGADSAVFHPIGSLEYKQGDTFKIITHHWSDNWLKGFEEYFAVDRMIEKGKLKGVELVVMGRYPKEIQWRSANIVPPQHGKGMAEQLRQCHAYITASKWEPCGMHHVEGAQCGLPLIYHKDGGGIEEAGLRYGIGFRDDPQRAILKMRDDWLYYRKKLLQNIPSGDLMCIEYGKLVQMLRCNL